MAVYTKETALYDTGAIDTAITNAGGTATNYLTVVSGTTGISVHNANDNSNLVNINSNGMTIYKGGVADANKVAVLGDTITLGKTSASHLIADSNGVSLHQNTTQVGSFSSTSIVLGSESDCHVLITPTFISEPELHMNLLNGSNDTLLSVWANESTHAGGISFDDFSNTGRHGALQFSRNQVTVTSFDDSSEPAASSVLNITPYGLNFDGPNKVLWNGTATYMTANQTVNLSENVSDQLTGIVLVWSRYANGAAQNDSWWYEFVPKWHTNAHNGGGIYMTTPTSNTSNVMCHKYIYVYDNKLEGHTSNSATGTGYANNTRALRAVLGV